MVLPVALLALGAFGGLGLIVAGLRTGALGIDAWEDQCWIPASTVVATLHARRQRAQILVIGGVWVICLCAVVHVNGAHHAVMPPSRVTTSCSRRMHHPPVCIA